MPQAAATEGATGGVSSSTWRGMESLQLSSRSMDLGLAEWLKMRGFDSDVIDKVRVEI